MSRVKKPCPACKTTDSTRPDADSICYKCQGIFERAKKLDAQAARVDKTEVYVSTCERDYALPSWYGISKYVLPETKTNDRMKQAFFKLINSLVIRDASSVDRLENKDLIPVPPLENGTHREWQRRVVMTRAHAEAVNELDAAMRLTLTEVASLAYKKGNNLLMNIASGDLSMNQINEATIGEER